MAGYTSIVIGILFCKNDFAKIQKIKTKLVTFFFFLWGKKLPYFEQCFFLKIALGHTQLVCLSMAILRASQRMHSTKDFG
jgi:hypothetical protein